MSVTFVAMHIRDVGDDDPGFLWSPFMKQIYLQRLAFFKEQPYCPFCMGYCYTLHVYVIYSYYQMHGPVVIRVRIVPQYTWLVIKVTKSWRFFR